METNNATTLRDAFLAIGMRTSGLVSIVRQKSVFRISLAIIYLSPSKVLDPVFYSWLNSSLMINCNYMTFQTGTNCQLNSGNHYQMINPTLEFSLSYSLDIVNVHSSMKILTYKSLIKLVTIV